MQPSTCRTTIGKTTCTPFDRLKPKRVTSSYSKGMREISSTSWRRGHVRFGSKRPAPYSPSK
eukprot:31756-Eustigmatos_ZCMA.PRE.1